VDINNHIKKWPARSGTISGACLKSQMSRDNLTNTIMKKLVVLFLLAFGLGAISNAQDYHTGVGLRAGYENGLTIKHFIGQKSALEGIISSRWQGFGITGLYEIQNRAFNTPGWNWFFGFGAHVGFWNGNHAYWGEPGTSYTVVGADGILGLEYCFREVPINLSLDWKPAFNFYGYSGYWGDGGALSIRYIF
jgi:hypothetical protein